MLSISSYNNNGDNNNVLFLPYVTVIYMIYLMLLHIFAFAWFVNIFISFVAVSVAVLNSLQITEMAQTSCSAVYFNLCNFLLLFA